MIFILNITRRYWRELAGFALLFRLTESLCFAPMAGLVGKWLLGRAVLDSTAVVSFLLSPRGCLALVLTVVADLTLRLIEHAGLSAIFFAALQSQRLSTLGSFRIVGRNLFTLIKVSASLAAIGFALLLPLVLVTGAFALQLLSKHDINYFLKLHPPEFITAAMVIGLAALITLIIAVTLVARWRWVVQTILFEGKGPQEAFARTASLTRGRRWKLTGVSCLVLLASTALGFFASLFGTGCTWLVLGVIDLDTISLPISFGLLLLLRTVIGAACSFLGSCLGAGVFTHLYHQRIAETGETAQQWLGDAERSRTPLWLPVEIGLVVLAFAGSGVGLAVSSLSHERNVTIHAHRGVASRAPENTLAAAREAIAAGADYLEIDVQLSKDDVLVVTHDSDFSRLAGVAKKVWELTYEEIRAIPLGSRSAPEFRTEVTPTFAELLADCKGKIKLNIELKYYGNHQPGLARKVLEAVRAHDMQGEVIIQCLEYNPLQEVHQLAPTVPIGYLLSFNARKPTRLNVDFLSVEQNRVTRSFLLAAHRSGQHVLAWTVNAEKDMQRLLDLGVDGLITDEAALGRETLVRYLNCPASERIARRTRAWLMD